jgi:hypothetical protein
MSLLRSQVVAPKVAAQEETKWNSEEFAAKYCTLDMVNDALAKVGLELPFELVSRLPTLGGEKPFYVGDKVRLLDGFKFPEKADRFSKILIKRDDPKSGFRMGI